MIRMFFTSLDLQNINFWLLVDLPTPLKNDGKSLGKDYISHILWKIKFMFQTTNQFSCFLPECLEAGHYLQGKTISGWTKKHVPYISNQFKTAFSQAKNKT